MPDNTFPCARCGRSIDRGTDEPGTLVPCASCKSHVVVPARQAGGAAQAAPAAFSTSRNGKRLPPLWVFFGGVLAACLLALGLIFFFIQRNSRDQAAFMEAMQAAENADPPEEGIRLIEQMLGSRLDVGQKAQARTLRLLLNKRVQVDASAATARREEAARKAAAAVKPLPPPPPSPPAALTLDDARAAYGKGLRLASGDGRDEAGAFVLVSRAATIGLPEAQHDLAAMHAHGIGCATNPAAAMLWARRAAEQGDVDAQAWLGQVLVSGTDVPADPVQAAQWNEKAAAQGHAVATLNLAIQCVNGQGVRLDCARAFSQFAAAAARGSAEAQVNLGVMYWKGLGVPQDPTNAFRCFQKAHEQGSAPGTFALGLLYGSGSGVAKDRQMASACFLAAARRGHVGAQKQIGRMYLTGSGVPWSEQDSIYWYRMAAAQGDEYARQAVDAYRNTHLAPVVAPCEGCQAKGAVVRPCRDCRGAGTVAQVVTSKSIKSCKCGWQIINGRCPNCGYTDQASRTLQVPCAACGGTGRKSVPCGRCGGSGQVRVSGPAQATFTQMVSRPDPGAMLATSATYAPVRLQVRGGRAQGE
ncbi:MAG: hypothetical protein WCI17_08695 [bacterium]